MYDVFPGVPGVSDGQHPGIFRAGTHQVSEDPEGPEAPEGPVSLRRHEGKTGRFIAPEFFTKLRRNTVQKFPFKERKDNMTPPVSGHSCLFVCLCVNDRSLQ